jgi:hypothetical protein
VGVASGPRWSLAWGGGSRFGVEFDLTLLQDRVGLSFGFRNSAGGTEALPEALTIADLNGMPYCSFPRLGARNAESAGVPRRLQLDSIRRFGRPPLVPGQARFAATSATAGHRVLLP